jgi:ABC-2 type transport system permease protein
MFVSMLQIEQDKMFRRKLLWVESAMIAAVIAFILAAAFFDPQTRAEIGPSLPWPGGIEVGGRLAASDQMGTIMMLVLVSALVTQEYSWGTLALLLSRGVSRPMAFLSKLAAIVLGAATLGLAALALGAVASVAFTLFTGQALIFQPADLRPALSLLGGTVLSLLPYIGLYVLLSVVSRSPITTMGLGMGLFFGEIIGSEILGTFDGILAQSTLYFPMALGQQLFAGLQPGAAVSGPLTAPICALLLVVYGAILSAIALAWFMKQDLTA